MKGQAACARSGACRQDGFVKRGENRLQNWANMSWLLEHAKGAHHCEQKDAVHGALAEAVH